MDKKNQLMDVRNQVPDMPTFEEDDFDLLEHKNTATAKTKAKARVKRDRRKLSVGRLVIAIAAMAVCALLYFMAVGLVGILS